MCEATEKGVGGRSMEVGGSSLTTSLAKVKGKDTTFISVHRSKEKIEKRFVLDWSNPSH